MPGTRRGSERRKMECAVLVRMEANAHADLQRFAELEGETTAGLLRRLAAEGVGALPKASLKTRVAAPAQLAALGEVAARTAMLTGLMTQIALHLRMSGDTRWHPKAEAAIRDLKTSAEILQRLIEEAAP